MRRYTLLGLAVAALLTACQESSQPMAPPPDLQASLTPGQAPDRYIVVLDPLTIDVDGEAGRLSEKHRGELERVFRYALKGYVARMSDVDAESLRHEQGVQLVEQDGLMHATTTQTNPVWGLDRIDQRNLPLSNSYTYNASGSGVSVYVIDTGIRTTHNEFGGRASGVFTSINDGNGTNDCYGHGTHVSGTIGGSTYGVAKGVDLYAVRVLDCTGSGSTSGVIAGIDWVTANAIKPAVANMSLGGSPSTALDAAVQNSVNSGVTYVVSAGNNGALACNQSPARSSAALTVGATNASDSRASFSNYGSCVDLFAPGVSIQSAYNTSNTATAFLSGTSMAAPHVAGAAALYLETQPSASPSAVMGAVTSNATSGKIPNPGAGSPNLLLYTGFIGTPPPSVGKVLTITQGDNQTGDVNTLLPEKLQVRVTDTNGNPVGGERVTFTVTSGGGTLVRYSDPTGAAGYANTRWTLGPAAGTQTVEASIQGAAPVTFSATAIAAPPTQTAVLTIMSGNNQTGDVNTQLPDKLVVRVTDTNGNPQGGVQVTFTVTTGGGTLIRYTDTTGAAGLANTKWTLGPVVGTQTIEVGTAGATPVTFSATATGGPPPQPTVVLTITGGDNQSGPVNTELPERLWVHVTDTNGNPLGGVQVTFTVVTGGGTLIRYSDTTGAAGNANTKWTLGPATGTQMVEARAAGATAVTFTATAN